MNRNYQTLHQAIHEDRAEWAYVPARKRCTDGWFCKRMICSRHNPLPTVWEERWKVKRFFGLTWIFYTPRNHWRRWHLVAAFKSERDANVYVDTL